MSSLIDTSSSTTTTAVTSVPKVDETTDDRALSQTLSRLVLDQLNVPDCHEVLKSQQKILERLDVMNQSVVESNQISLQSMNTVGVQGFQPHIAMLNGVRNDLDFIFKRIKAIKTKLQAKYPSEFEHAVRVVKSSAAPGDEDDEEADGEVSFNNKPTNVNQPIVPKSPDSSDRVVL